MYTLLKNKALLLGCTLLLLPFQVKADDSGSCGQNVNYNYEESTGKLTISGSGAMTDFTWDSMPWYNYIDEIKYVEIKEGVTTIGTYSFCNGFNISSVTIPNSVVSVGAYSFGSCSNSLTSIIIPKSVTSIGDNAFMNCVNLSFIVVESGNTVYDSRDNCNSVIETSSNTLLFGSNNTKIPESVTSIASMACYRRTGLTSLSIPAGVVSIGDYAFCSCSGLNSIIVEEGNTIYDSRENCNAIIETVTCTLVQGCNNTKIPNGITSIASSAFGDCSTLSSITIPSTVTSVGNLAFSRCSSLSTVYIFAPSLETYGYMAFAANADGRKIFVPESSLSTYMEGWPDFADSIFPMEESRIEESTTIDKIVKGETYYFLSGQRIDSPHKGIYIVGGKKVIVK